MITVTYMRLLNRGKKSRWVDLREGSSSLLLGHFTWHWNV
uniref:Uncharacterized protein n=1 Tax=Anguilla anguilla TaxID=7936 RepID=A0A0E9S8C3_ANGAN